MDPPEIGMGSALMKLHGLMAEGGSSKENQGL